MINCSLSSKRSEQNEWFKSSEHVGVKGVQLKRRAATDKGTERSSLQSFHLHYNRESVAKVHSGPRCAHTPGIRVHEEIKY